MAIKLTGKENFRTVAMLLLYIHKTLYKLTLHIFLRYIAVCHFKTIKWMALASLPPQNLVCLRYVITGCRKLKSMVLGSHPMTYVHTKFR